MPLAKLLGSKAPCRPFELRPYQPLPVSVGLNLGVGRWVLLFLLQPYGRIEIYRGQIQSPADNSLDANACMCLSGHQVPEPTGALEGRIVT